MASRVIPAVLPLLAAGVASLTAPSPCAAQDVPAPAAFIGYPIGADRHLVRWEKIIEYLNLVAARSPRVRIDTLGKTTLGNPFVIVLVSSPENLASLDRLTQITKRLASGRGSADEARQLAAQGKVFVVINHNIHSTEIAASQATLEMVYDLATDTTAATREILDNVVLVHIPSANPDGQIMTVDWYTQNVGTPYERSPMPWLYHHYAGHDNNRDFFMGNLIETRYLQDVFYRRFAPQVMLDQHQQGANGARMFVPPFPDPPNPHVHPLIWQQTEFFGGAMATALQAAEKHGVQTQGSNYRIYHQGGTLTVWWHNIIGLLTEAASASVATPLMLRADQLQMPSSDGIVSSQNISKNFPDPWPGGVWRLRDAMEYQLITARATLTQAARYREELLYQDWLMARDAIARARTEGPFAYVVAPALQADPLTAADMVQRLINQGIEVERATEPFMANGTTYPTGSLVIPTQQAASPALVDLMEPQSYPEMRRYDGGPPIRPYDVTGYTLPLQMGVGVARLADQLTIDLQPVTDAQLPIPDLPAAQRAYVLDPRINQSVVAVNRLLAAGVPVHRLARAVRVNHRELPPGGFVIPASGDARGVLRAVERDVRLPVAADPTDLPATASAWGPTLTTPRIGLYKSWVASIDEGWTRWLLERYGFTYASLDNAAVRGGTLHDRFDVIILPAETSLENLITGYPADREPAPYTGGIGEEGVASLRAFVRAGGMLVTLDGAGDLVLERFGVPVKNVLAGAKTSDFFCPGTILRLSLDTTHPLGYGLPHEVAAKFVRSPAYAVSSPHARVVASYPSDRPILMSGLLIGEEYLAGRAAVVDVQYGEGRIVMLGFRVQHRGQTAGTFKLLFNALYDWAMK